MGIHTTGISVFGGIFVDLATVHYALHLSTQASIPIASTALLMELYSDVLAYIVNIALYSSDDNLAY